VTEQEARDKDQSPEGEVRELLGIIEEIAEGKYSNRVMEFTKSSHTGIIRRVAEAVGMMMVKVEIREFHLEQLVEQLRELNALLKKNIVQTVTTIANALGARDEYTEGHAQRVAAYSERIARRIGLTEEEVERVRIGGMLHDIGKIGVSDRVFSNQDVSISEGLLEEIHQHPGIGVAILKDLDFLGPVVDYVGCHHEREDGRGYPGALGAEEIPLGAKIISVADCFDAITTDRPYQKGKTRDEAFGILRELSGNALDSELVEAFIQTVQGEDTGV
jgi:putative nucleotidyltransferase with HDIG domain